MSAFHAAARGALLVASVLGLFVAGSLPAQTARVHVTSLSLVLQPAGYDAMQGQINVLFSTPDRVDLSSPPVLRPGMNNELAPRDASRGNYGTEFVAVRGGAVHESGRVQLTFPEADANGNLLADFLETDAAANVTVSGTSIGQGASGESRTYRIEGRFERAANTDQGHYQLVFTPSPAGASYSGFALEEKFFLIANDPTRSRLLYERGGSASAEHGLRVELRDYGSEALTTGSTRYHAAHPDSVNLQPLLLLDSAGDRLQFRSFTAQRLGNRYVGFPTTEDGVSATAQADFTRWHIEITDTNDVDANGVPDFSDARYRPLSFELKVQPAAIVAGAPLSLTADTKGLPVSNISWFVGVPGSDLRIPIAASSATTLQLAPFIPLLAPHWSPSLPGLETAMEVHAVVTGGAGINTVTGHLTLPRLLGEAVAQPFRRGLSSAWTSSPGAYLNTNLGVTFGLQPVVLRAALSEAAITYFAADFQGYQVDEIDGPAFTLHLRAHATVDAMPDGLAVRISGHGKTAGSSGTVRFALLEGDGRQVATGALDDVVLGTIPLMVTDDGWNVRVYAGGERKLVLEGVSTYRRGFSLAFTGQQRGNDGQISTTDITVYDTPWLALSRGSRLSNMSTRGVVGAGEQAMIFGAVVRGLAPVVVRGLGPGLAAFGVADAIANPRLTVYRDSTLIAANDDWGASTDSAALRNAFARVGAFALADRSLDSAAMLDFSAGAYTAVVENATGVSGSALLELYQADAGSGTGRLANLSTRGYVRDTQQPLIAGLVVTGPAVRTVLIRGVGAQLRRFGVSGFLSNPLLQVFSANGREVARNDKWTENEPNRVLIDNATNRLGTFALEAFGDDAAIVMILPPGAYTVQVTGAQMTAGVALVEIYDLQ